MKQFILALFMALAFTVQSQQVFTVASDSTNATFSYTLDASQTYTFTLVGYYKTPQVHIRPAFNPDNAYQANWDGNITTWATFNKNWNQVYANYTYFELPNLPSPTRKNQTLNVWLPYSCSFQITGIQSSGTYPLYLNTNMGIPVGLQWKAGTTVTITQN